jgi:hypothetical protein
VAKYPTEPHKAKARTRAIGSMGGRCFNDVDHHRTCSKAPFFEVIPRLWSAQIPCATPSWLPAFRFLHYPSLHSPFLVE